jgi:hypothetical protein
MRKILVEDQDESIQNSIFLDEQERKEVQDKIKEAAEELKPKNSNFYWYGLMGLVVAITTILIIKAQKNGKK